MEGDDPDNVLQVTSDIFRYHEDHPGEMITLYVNRPTLPSRPDREDVGDYIGVWLFLTTELVNMTDNRNITIVMR
jgi:hypothetical protein